MGLPNLDYTALATELLPVPRRQPLFKQVMAAFMKSTSWLYDRFYNYLHGATIDVWDVGTTYNAFDVVYWNFKIYVCLVDGTVGVNPSTSIGVKWDVYTPMQIGAYERACFRANKVMFEYSLNHYFGTTFNQPPSTSDIYISPITPSINTFLYGDVTDYYSADGSTGWVTATEAYPTVVTFTYIINFPLATYTALGAEAESIIRNFADTINVAGVSYLIQTY